MPIDPKKTVSVQAYVPVEINDAINKILTDTRKVEPSFSKSQVITALLASGIQAIAKNNTNNNMKGKVN